MADLPELWTEKTPERRLFDRTPAFGLARVAEQLEDAVPEPEPEPAEPPRPKRERGPFVTYLSMPWSYDDPGGGGALWHRIRCRLRRHDITGGHTMQLGGDVVFVERQCRWCGVTPTSG